MLTLCAFNIYSLREIQGAFIFHLPKKESYASTLYWYMNSFTFSKQFYLMELSLAAYTSFSSSIIFFLPVHSYIIKNIPMDNISNYVYSQTCFSRIWMIKIPFTIHQNEYPSLSPSVSNKKLLGKSFEKICFSL